MLDQVCGPVTGVNLEHMTPLMLPWTQDPWGEMRPPVSVEAMRMSAELAAATMASRTDSGEGSRRAALPLGCAGGREGGALEGL